MLCAYIKVLFLDTTFIQTNDTSRKLPDAALEHTMLACLNLIRCVFRFTDISNLPASQTRHTFSWSWSMENTVRNSMCNGEIFNTVQYHINSTLRKGCRIS